MDTRFQASEARPSDRTGPLLRVFLLGRFEVVREDAPIPASAWRRRRPADLLTLVAVTPGRALSREQVIDALWPDKDPSSGANNLHRALYDLRQILGGRWVDIERGQVRLRGDVWVDVDAFERAVAAGGPERQAEAVALYRGDLAPDDLDAPWLAARRQVLRAHWLEAAWPHARALAERTDAAALPLLRRLVELDPQGEDAHRLLIRLLAESGRRAEALRQYDACEAALRVAGLGPPSDETRALRRDIQAGTVGAPPARSGLDAAQRVARRLLGTPAPPPLRGRAALLLVIEALLERGSGAVILLGERGAGKTRLAVEGARLAQARGAAVLCGVGGATPRGAPFGLFADLFREEARAHPGAPDPFAPGEVPEGARPEAAGRLTAEAVVRALSRLGEGRPLYLLLDDLHDADDSSLNLLHHLARHARELQLVLVATCREDLIHAGTPLQMALAHLDGGRLARGVRVPRLGLAATREQVGDLLGETAVEPHVLQVYRATDGNPFLVEEALRSQRALGPAVPSDPLAALRARVERLGPRVEALLAAAAVAGRYFDFELVRPVSGLTAHEAVEALEACVDARLLDEDGAGYHFRHGLLLDAVRDGLSPARAAALHGALADRIEALGGHAPPSEALAFHLARAGQPERAFRHLVAAGHRAAARAGLAEALAFYEEARALSALAAGAERPGAASAGGPGSSGGLELLDAIGRVQLELGETSDALRTFDEAATQPEGAAGPDARARACWLAGVAAAAAGRLDVAATEVEVGLSTAALGSGDEPAALLHLRAHLAWHAARPADALAAAEACEAAATQAGDEALGARAADLAAAARGLLGQSVEPATPAPTAQEPSLLADPVDLHLVLWDRDLLGDLPVQDLSRGAALLAERARQRGDPLALAAARLGEGTFALACGHLEAAEPALRAALEGFRPRGGAPASALGEALALEKLGTLLALSGRLDAAEELLGEGVVVAERASLRRHALVRLHAAETRRRLAAGLVTAALDAVHEASETAARHGECHACDAAFRPELVRVELARGRIDEAEAEARALDELARTRGGRGLGALAAVATARVLGARGRTEDALAALAAARTAFLAAGQRYEAARTARLERRLRGVLPDAHAPLDALVMLDADA